MAVSIKIPEQAEVSFKLEIIAKANITPYGAKQIVDDFLLLFSCFQRGSSPHTHE